MNKGQWQCFEGTRHQVGFKLGRYWASELQRKLKHGPRKGLVRLVTKLSLLGEGWTAEHDQLLQRLGKVEPGIIAEIEAIAEGVKAGGVAASIKGIFRWCLGEANFDGCSTIAFRGSTFTALAHNEEYYPVEPLCFAKVQIRESNKHSKFLSISYPFQLFGSAAGANACLAFTGNSIGMRERPDYLNSRIPKTVFTRLALEQKTIRGALQVFRRYAASLPGHWFVSSRRSITSVQVRPAISISERDVSDKAICSPFDFHTNHFRRGPWMFWSDDEDGIDESRCRFQQLKRLTKSRKFAKTPGGNAALLDALRELRKTTKWDRRETSASILIVLTSTGATVQGIDYYRKRLVPECGLLA